MIVWVSGPTGSGKSTLVELLSDVGFAVVREVINADLLAAFAKDPAHNCAALQKSILKSRFDQWHKIRANDKIVFDRSIDEDLNIFCYMHYAAGLLTDQEISFLSEFAKGLQKNIQDPDIILYMSPARKILEERVIKGSHPPAIIEGLGVQLSLYNKWLTNQKYDVLQIDNALCTVESVQKLFGGIDIC